jgi:hypothetical protein
VSQVRSARHRARFRVIRNAVRGRVAPIVAGVAVVAIALLGANLGTGSRAEAAGSILLTDSFTGPTVHSQEYVVGGTGATTAGTGTNVACLTAAGSPVGQVPASCADTADAVGSGALRITQKQGAQTGFLLNDHALPTKAGLDISFDMFQYGGNGADGITFFLSDGAYALTSVGAAGGSLGYSNSTKGSGIGKPGVPHGLLGVAFDAYGNFTYETNNASCATDPTWIGAARSPQTVAVRGPGVLKTDGTWNDGYCLLGAPKAPTDGKGIDNTATQTRAAAVRHVRIVIDPPTDAAPQVSVYLGDLGDGSATAPTLVAQVPEPSILATTPTFKFGWAGSTGGSTDVHEVSALVVDTVNVIPPQLTEAATSPAAFDAGGAATVGFTATVRASEGQIVAGDTVTQTVTNDGSLAWGALPSATGGWLLQSSDATHAVYTWTAADLVLPGTVLPTLTLPVSSALAGAHQVTALVSGGGIVEAANPDSERTAVATVNARPTVAPVTGTTAPSSATPQAITVATPTPGGGGSPAFAIVSPPASGTASIDPATGVVSFTPAAGASGITTFTYAATVGGVQSTPATVTVSTAPSVADNSATTPYGTPVTVDLSTGAEGTGLGYSVVTGPPSSAGTVAVSGGSLTFTPASGFTGSTTATFRASDADGLLSAPATVTVTVQPQAVTDSLTLSLAADGTGSATSALPAPNGSSGPFSYALVTAPSAGTLIVSANGHYSYTAATDTTGVFTGTYTVTDANGVVSPAATITLTVRPFAAPVTGATPAGTPITLGVPDTAGATGGTFAVVQPTTGSATIDTATGAITFTPAPGASGIAGFSYTVTANGVASTGAAVTVNVIPAATDKTVTAVAGTPKAIDLSVGAVGSGLTYSIVASPGAAGATSLDAATGALVFTPASGFSGATHLTFRATDASGLHSATRTVTINVQPTAGTSTPVLVLPQGGSAPQSFALPAPSGSGPFTYAIVPGSTPAGSGIFTIDPATGVVTYTPVSGQSGVFPAAYTITDGNGVTSAPQAISVTERPYAAPVTKTANGGQASYPLPTPVTAGTGPLAYAFGTPVDPALGTATIDPATGVVTFVPATPAMSGIVRFTYLVTDAGGTPSAPTTGRLTVRPSTAPVTGTMKGARVAPPSMVVTPPGHGTGPFTFTVLSQPAHGTVTATPAGLSFTPDAGFAGLTTLSFAVVDSSGTMSDPELASITVTQLGTLAFTGADDVPKVVAVGIAALLAGFVLLLVVVARRRRG